MIDDQLPQLTPESQAFYQTWFQEQYSETRDELQVLDPLCDLDQRLYEFIAPAFQAHLGAPARDVIRVLRALRRLFIKNIGSENGLVNQELKNNVRYRWFVGLEQGAVVRAAFRVRMVRLRQRIMARLGRERLQGFLAETVALAQAQYEPAVPVAAPPATPDLSQVSGDLTTTKGRARIVEARDNPGRKRRLPSSAGDAQAYWIKKTYPTADGVRTEVTLGDEVGLWTARVGGLVGGVWVRRSGEENQRQFNDWARQYQRDGSAVAPRLSISADREFWTGSILRHAETQGWTLWVPSKENKPPGGKLDPRYFPYVREADLWVCPEGVEWRRTGHDAQRQRTIYRAPPAAGAACPTAARCKGGRGPRKVTRSDFAEAFARGRQRQGTPEYRPVRRAIVPSRYTLLSSPASGSTRRPLSARSASIAAVSAS